MVNMRKYLTAGAAVLTTLLLVACGQKAHSTGTSAKTTMLTKFSGPGHATAAGNKSTLRIAEINDAPFTGIAATSLQSNTEDADMFSPGSGNVLFNVDDNNKIIDGGLANMRLNRQAQTVTITLRKNARWSNGSKVIARDVAYPYEIIGSPQSPSPQYSNDYAAIQGMAAFHAGKAQRIAGISLPNGAPRGDSLHQNGAGDAVSGQWLCSGDGRTLGLPQECAAESALVRTANSQAAYLYGSIQAGQTGPWRIHKLGAKPLLLG